MEIDDILAAVKKDLDEIDRLNKEIGILFDLRDGLLGRIKKLEELFGSFRTQKIPSVEGATNNDRYRPRLVKAPLLKTTHADIFMCMVAFLMDTNTTESFTVSMVCADPTISDQFHRDQVSQCVHRYTQCGFIERIGYRAYKLTSEGMKYYQENKHRHRAMLQD